MNHDITSDPGHRTRALDESVRHGHDATARVESVLASLLGDLTGNYGAANAQGAGPPEGLVFSADTLASRLEALARLAIEVKEKVIASNIVGVGVASQAQGLRNY